MFSTHKFAPVALLVAIVSAAPPSQAGGVLEGFRFTKQPSPIPGEVIVQTVPGRWSDRCLPIRWRVNNTNDPVPNASYAPTVSLAEASDALKRALETWNDVPTAFVSMQLVGTVSNAAPAFDMINEVYFGKGFSGTRARSIRLVEDTVLADGDDINGDGIPDVSAKLTTCQDIGGRTKLPAGFYRAGTVLEVDLIYDYDSQPFSVRDEDLEISYLYDFQGVVTHEFGHALGLSHSVNTQRSDRDGRDAIMGGPYTFDPVFKRLQRSLDSDDIAWASYLYPEGTAAKGPAALQTGDVAFASRYGLMTGALRHGRERRPIPGGVVVAKSLATREIVASSYTGNIRLSGNPDTGELNFLPPEDGIVDGKFAIPVPAGTYALTVLPSGFPEYPTSLTNNAGSFYGLLDFFEEGVNRHDDAIELRPGDADPFRVRAGYTTFGIDISTNRTLDVSGVGPNNAFSPAGLDSPTGPVPIFFVAGRISATQYAELTHSRTAPLLGANFLSVPADPSAVQRYPGAMLTTGFVDPDGSASVDLAQPLVRLGPFVSRDYQFTPLYFDDPIKLGRQVSNGIARGEIENLFFVLQIPSAPFPGPSNLPPLLGESCSSVRESNFYFSVDGKTFAREPFCNLKFALIVAEPGTH